MKRKPGRVFFALIYILGSLLIFYLVLWAWKPDMIELIQTDLDLLISERLVFLSTIFIIPSLMILKGKKIINVKTAAIISGIWILFFVLVIVINVATAQKVAEWLKNITKPLLFITILGMFVWSCIELSPIKTQEKKR